MGSTQANPDERDLRYLKLIAGRHEGRPEKEIAASMGYDSPVDLYRQIKRDGHPICPTCGTTYPVEGHCEQPKGEYKLQARKAGGEATDASLGQQAIGLFQAALEIHQKNILDLERRREYFKDGRFIVEHAYSGDAGESCKTHHRGDMSDADWEAYCRKHGKDPALDSFDVPADYVAPGGVSQAPPEPLTKLIAMYILSGLLIETMLAALHPEPKNVDMEQLKLHIHGKKTERGIRPGLEGEARRIARLVRGGTLNRQGGAYDRRAQPYGGRGRQVYTTQATKRGAGRKNPPRTARRAWLHAERVARLCPGYSATLAFLARHDHGGFETSGKFKTQPKPPRRLKISCTFN
jgi:hypothetical protein